MDFAYDSSFGDKCINVYKQMNISNAYFSSCRNIQSGTITGVTSNGYTVSFTKSFINTPRVICTPLQAYAGNEHFIVANITSVSKTGFTVKTKDFIGSYGSDIMWIAIDIS